MADSRSISPEDFGAELTALLQLADLTPDQVCRQMQRSGWTVGRSSLYDWRKGRHLPGDAEVVLAVVRVCRAAASQRGTVLDSVYEDDEYWRGILARAKLARDSRTVGHGLGGISAFRAAAASRGLPADIASFTGRHAQLEAVKRSLPDRAVSGGVVRIDAIDGMAGIGKTTFAVHAAHQLAARFPDGQIFVRLHGHTPGQQPVEPADALATLLLTTGIAPQQIPAGLEARQELWRSRMAGKRILLVLDDAIGSDHVKPLLPGTANALVLITSRRRLTALTEAIPITLETLSLDEAAHLFTRLSHRPGLEPSDQAVAEIVALCGYLPLAISLMAGQLKYHDTWTTRSLADDLASARHRLGRLRAENISVTAALDLSLRDLAPEQQRLFQRLGLHPGNDIDSYASAALYDTDPDTVHRWLDELYNHHLIEEPARDRYRFHDLVREHARALATELEAAERDAAMDRLLGYYLCAAITAGQKIDLRLTARMPSRYSQMTLPELCTRQQAIEWMKAERPNLHMAASCAIGRMRSSVATGIAAAMSSFLHQQGYWEQALELFHPALASARDCGDQQGEADALVHLGVMQFLIGDCLDGNQNLERALYLYRYLGDRRGEADALGSLTGFNSGDGKPGRSYRTDAADLTQVLGIYQELDDNIGQADTLLSLGCVYGALGDCAQGAIHENRAYELYREAGELAGEANALNNLGWLHMEMGNYSTALVRMEQALKRYRDLNIKQGEANMLIDISTLQRRTGNYVAALASQQRSLQLYRELGDRHGEANALSNLGVALQANGNYEDARQSIQQAVQMQRDLGSKIGQAEALNNLGELLFACSSAAEAFSCHEQALEMARGLAAPREEARALEGIGQCYLRSGESAKADTTFRQAMAIYESISAPDAKRVAEIIRDFRTS